jgi:hypothetical protein
MDIFVSTRSKDDYLKVKNEADKPIGEREKIIKTNRGTLKSPRKYHVSEDKLKKFIVELDSGKYPNPYRNNGLYHFFIQTLINLGVNQKHSFIEVKKEMRDLMSKNKNSKGTDFWTDFNSKISNKSSFCAKDVNGKIIENAFVLQRIGGFHPYGFKALQLHYCVDIFKDINDLPIFMLRYDKENINILLDEKYFPINEFKIYRKNKGVI